MYDREVAGIIQDRDRVIADAEALDQRRQGQAARQAKVIEGLRYSVLNLAAMVQASHYEATGEMKSTQQIIKESQEQ